MIRIAILLVAALVATLPSGVIAQIYLRRQGQSVPVADTVKTFMQVAPGTHKFALISLNFLCFSVLCGGGMLATMLIDL